MKLEDILPEIRKGRGFRRKAWPCNKEYYMDRETLPGSDISGRELLADDWELEPRKVEITREKLSEAWNADDNLWRNFGTSESNTFFDIFCRRLGL